MKEGQVLCFFPSKTRESGYGFLDIGEGRKGRFFHASNGRKLNAEGTGFSEEVESRLPREGDVLCFEEAQGRKDLEATPWAFKTS